MSFRTSMDVRRAEPSATETATSLKPSPQLKPPTLVPIPPHRFALSARSWALAAVAVVLAGAGWLTVRHYLSERLIATGSATSVARAEDFVKVIRLTGTTAAVHSRPILVPTLEGAQLSQLVITNLVPAGARVKKGDLLAEFDRQAQLKDALDKHAAYQDLLDLVSEKRAAEAAAKAKDQTELAQAENALKKAQLEVSKNDIVSKIDAEKNQETLTEAVATLKQLQQTFKLKRQSAAADIRSAEIKAERAKETMLYAQSNAGKMRILSPMDGVVVLNMVWTGSRMGEVQEGDDVRPGLPFMKVVDPSQMDVSVQANQADFPDLHVGQRARVHLDAYPSMVFSGRLDQLSPIAHGGQFSDKVHTFSATFALDGNNPKLMPDLSAAVDVEVDSVQNAVVVPIQSVGDDAGHEFVWLRDGSSFEKRPVKLGPRNDLDVVIESGLKSGDMVKRDALEPSGAGVS